MRNRFFPALAAACFLAIGLRSLPAQAPTPNENPEGNTGALKAQVETGGSYDAHSGNATRTVTDLHVPGALGVYGLDFTRYWNSLPNDHDNGDAVWSTDFGASGWSHSWGWSAVYGEQYPEEIPGSNNNNNIWTTSITITFPDGHANKYKIIRPGHGIPGANGDPRFGPPYSVPEQNWPAPGAGVHDRLCNMAPDGSAFWLFLADGGSVHFVGLQPPDMSGGYSTWSYRATEVFDPHGLRTDLSYNAGGYLTEVRQEGGRWLTIAWSHYAFFETLVIGRVETGGYAGAQSVTYKYSRFPDQNGHSLTLTKVTYENDPAPGQNVSAIYTYGRCYGEEPCNDNYSNFPLLKRADDPRFAGPMRTIRYRYRGSRCEPWQHPTYDPPTAKFDYFYAQPEALASERSGEHVDQFNNPVLVSGFSINCWSGTRRETSGLGGWRDFFYGHSATWPGSGSFGFELAKLTDFYTGSSAGVTSERANHLNGQPYQRWDGRNLVTRLEYWDDSGQPSEIHHHDESSRSYDRINPGNSEDRDEARIPNRFPHWLFSQTNELDQTTTYTRDARRRVTRIDYPGGSYETFAYDGNITNSLNQVVTHRLPSGGIVHYEYDGFHRLVREWNSVDGSSEYTEYTYDGLERVATMGNPRARAAVAPYSTMMKYNGRHQVTEVHYPATDGNSDPTVFYEYDKYGNCTAITNELNHRSTYEYDEYRRCISYTEPLNAPGCNGAASRTWDWVYDRDIEGVGWRSAYSHTSKEWRLQHEPVFNNAGQRRTTARQHDLNNRLKIETTGLIMTGLTSWVESGDTETHSFTYDENGNKSSYKDPLGRMTTYTYDNRNRLETTTEPKRLDQTDYPVTRLVYDWAGNKKMVTFPDTTTQKWDYYDAFGQPGQFTDERGNDTQIYYRSGPMKKLAGVLTHRSKDDSGTEDQPTSIWQDDLGRPFVTIFPDGSVERNTYEFGQLKTFTNRKGQTKVINLYDARGREKHHYWLKPDGSLDKATPAVNRLWDDANRLVTISNAFSTIAYSYDQAAQMLTEKTIVTGNTLKQLSYCRYPSGEVAQVTYPNGTIISRNYTTRGQLKDAGWGAGSTSYAYLADGKVDYQVFTGGVRTSYGYDGRGIISSVSHKNGSGESLAYREYWRDDRDRIIAWKRGSGQGLNGMENGRGDRYKYDDEGQLKRAWYRALNPETEEPGDPKRGDQFHYDELGNRMGSNWVANRGMVNFLRKDNKLNQYQNWYSVVKYDDDMGGTWGEPGEANGVMMMEGYITASFNSLNQPMAIWSPAYPNGASPQWMWFGFDPLGRCVKRWMGTVTGAPVSSSPAMYFYYDGWNLIQEGATGSAADRVHVHGGRVDEIVASWTGGEWRHHHYDARGHCILLTDPSGGVTEQYDYDAFGFPYFHTANGDKVASSQWGNRFLFTGREWLKDLRIYDFRARQYQPELGRFLQPDPIQFKAGDYNLYRYCHNDPVNNTDPTGLMSDGQISPEGIRAMHDHPQSVLFAAGLTAAVGAVLVAPVAIEVAGTGVLVVMSRAPMAARVLGTIAAAAGYQRGQLVSSNVKNYVDGRAGITASQLTKTELAKAIVGYQRAADMAKSAVERAFQVARIQFLKGEGPRPGTLSEFGKKWKENNP